MSPKSRREDRRPRLIVVGGGLAGCEAAWQAASLGLDVLLYEMKPGDFSPAHHSEQLAELVCSNSLRSRSLDHAVGLLKAEMRRIGSLLMAAADATQVAAGKALAVDRHAFARVVTQQIAAHPRISVRRERVDKIPDDDLVILATGPLTSPELAAQIQLLLGETSLYFYDAISPIVYADSIDPGGSFRASRYEEGEGDYLNLPLSQEEYVRFVEALLAADTVPLHPFERALYFEGCLPIEEMARRGRETLAHGPMRPVGLVDPRTGRRPHAVVQLRQEDRAGVLYNLVGFQTKLRVAEQRRVFRMIPSLRQARFARYGSLHRNTYINAPKCLTETLEVRGRAGLYLTGQLAGVEGYVESAALGGLAGIHASYAARREPPVLPAATCAHGALLRYLIEANPRRFQPMNINYGLFPPLAGSPRRLTKREKNRRLAERALDAIGVYEERLREGGGG